MWCMYTLWNDHHNEMKWLTHHLYIVTILYMCVCWEEVRSSLWVYDKCTKQCFQLLWPCCTLELKNSFITQNWPVRALWWPAFRFFIHSSPHSSNHRSTLSASGSFTILDSTQKWVHTGFVCVWLTPLNIITRMAGLPSISLFYKVK